MSDETTHPASCQVDFYLLGELSEGASKLACRLALMAWERKQKIFIITATQSSAEQLDKLMWQYPEGRFLPHAVVADQNLDSAPVSIGSLASLNSTDVVINLCPDAVPQPERFNRILEIVPCADDEKAASRVKYRTYRNLGLKPQTHEIKMHG